MIRLFVTGDNHIGIGNQKFVNVKEKLFETRFSVLEKMVKTANEEKCDFFVITGDLFENNNIAKKHIERVAFILSRFINTVLVLPGNHDFYNEEVSLWQTFKKSIEKNSQNTIILNELKPYELEIRDEKAVFYPAYCHDKHSDKNNLEWIKDIQSDIDKRSYNIGVAHGSIDGFSPDPKNEYYRMSEKELNAIPVDAWLIGHTHIPYPEIMKDEKEHKDYKIFNVGTHAQTDYSNNTPGYGFLLSMEKNNSKPLVSAKAIRTGEIRFYDLDVAVKAEDDSILEKTIKKITKDIEDDSIVRINICGCIKHDEYKTRADIYEECLGRFLSYEIEDEDLSEEITVEKIRDEYAETSFAARFLEELIDDPKEVAMAYELLQECKE